MIKSPTSKSKIFFIISAVLILVSVASLCIQGLNLGIDFTGGSTLSFDLGKTEYSNSVESRITAIIKENSDAKDIVVQKMGDAGVSIKTSELKNEESQAIVEAIKAEYNLSQENVSQVEKVSGSVSGELIKNALKAIIIAVALMLLYITWRFDFKSGTCAVIALAHDVIIMLGFYSIFRFTVNTSFVAAVLTILGYSINATIVVFDRVREKKRNAPKATPNEVADDAITNSYWRAINSSVTTLLTIGVLYIMGVDSIKEFALPIIIGIIAGTYSSLFIASPFWAFWNNHSKKSKANYANKKKKRA
ncbi:MAG: protein translocase subunit SecF [Ruminococcaceae bacterium]|nr:protein translocase subunit SecF [Oscillospiraceae bacterium]